MSFWITCWTLVFFGTVAVFAAMSIWVSWGGWKDIRDLLRDLDSKRERREEDGPSPGPPPPRQGRGRSRSRS